MLFHIIHQHGPDTCPAHDADLLEQTFGAMLERLEQPGIELKGFYSSASAHRVYLIVDTDDMDTLNDVLLPAFRIGTAQIEPVTETAATVKRLQQKARE